MKLPKPLEVEILKAAHRKGLILSPRDVQDFVLTVDDSYSHDGMSGAEIQRVKVAGLKNNSKTNFSFVVKPWDSTKWLTQLLGVERPLENILFESGFFDEVNAIEGLQVPIIGSVQLEDQAWIIMEDVSADLGRWKTSAFDGGELNLQRNLLDRMAFFHVNWEDKHSEKRFQYLQKQLVSQERRLRWFEPLCREWFGGNTQTASDSLALRRAKDQLGEVLREPFLNFIDHLPEKSRINWLNHMQHREGLVSEASNLPATFLHGDLVWKNIGLRQENTGNTFVLIDWEIATLGHHAFDVYYFMSEPFQDVNVWDEYSDYYYERYQFYGGSIMNRDQWNRGLDLAIAHYGLSWLPLFAEWVRNDNDNKKIEIVENIIERTSQALHGVPI